MRPDTRTRTHTGARTHIQHTHQDTARHGTTLCHSIPHHTKLHIQWLFLGIDQYARGLRECQVSNDLQEIETRFLLLCHTCSGPIGLLLKGSVLMYFISAKTTTYCGRNSGSLRNWRGCVIVLRLKRGPGPHVAGVRVHTHLQTIEENLLCVVGMRVCAYLLAVGWWMRVCWQKHANCLLCRSLLQELFCVTVTESRTCFCMRFHHAACWAGQFASAPGLIPGPHTTARGEALGLWFATLRMTLLLVHKSLDCSLLLWRPSRGMT
mmetsp:Transcript_77721/g.129708  ORF Transcript_77721/g.129708 Transcript_77721/m.129708 type:complete len:265 (-) Transcript_77721:553-1347(-)